MNFLEFEDEDSGEKIFLSSNYLMGIVYIEDCISSGSQHTKIESNNGGTIRVLGHAKENADKISAFMEEYLKYPLMAVQKEAKL